VELTWWQAYLINLGYIFACMLINMLGMSTMGHFSKVEDLPHFLQIGIPEKE